MNEEMDLEDVNNSALQKEINCIGEVNEFLRVFLRDHSAYFEVIEEQLVQLQKELGISIENVQQAWSKKKEKIEICRNKINEIFSALLSVYFDSIYIPVNLEVINNLFFNITPNVTPKKADSQIVSLHISPLKKPKSETEQKIERNKAVANLLTAKYGELKITLEKNEEIILDLMLSKYSLQYKNNISFLDDNFFSILDKAIEHLATKYENFTENDKFNSKYLQLYKEMLEETKKENCNYIIPQNYLFLQKLIDLQQNIIEYNIKYDLKKTNQIQLSENFQATFDHIMLEDEIIHYAGAFENLINYKEAEGLEVLKYLINGLSEFSFDENINSIRHVAKDHPVKNIECFAKFLSKLTNTMGKQEGKQEETQQEKIINTIINAMGIQVFDLINVHFQQETGPAGRDNSIVPSIAKRLVLRSKAHEQHIVNCIEPIIDIIDKQQLSIDKDFNYKGDIEAFVDAFHEAISKLFLIATYPPEIQRLIHDFAVKNKNELLGYFLTRFINPVILNYTNQSKDETIKFWGQHIIIMALQALTAVESKRVSYEKKIHSKLLDLVYDKKLRNLLKELCAAASIIDVSKLPIDVNKLCVEEKNNANNVNRNKLISHNIISQSTTNHNLKLLKAQSEFIRIEKYSKEFSKAIQYKNTEQNNCHLSIGERINAFSQKLFELKAFLENQKILREEKLKASEEVDHIKMNLVYICSYYLSSQLEDGEIDASTITSNEEYHGWIDCALELVRDQNISIDLARQFVFSKINTSQYENVDQAIALKQIIDEICADIVKYYHSAQEAKISGITDNHVDCLEILDKKFQKFIENYKEISPSNVSIVNSMGMLPSQPRKGNAIFVGASVPSVTTAITTSTTTTTTTTTIFNSNSV